MASITSYFRLEPDPLRPDVTVGATAPVHDPLWLLARQWQLGEFAAQDGGTPVLARWRGVAAEPTRFVAGPIPPDTAMQAPTFAALAAPLETLIEKAGVPLPSAAATLAGLRLGVDTGRLFLRLLAAQTVSRSLLLIGGDLLAPGRVLSGLLVDEWAEVVPSDTQTTGVAFRYDPPEAMPPQAILLAVPPVPGEAWTVGSLNQVLIETLELAHLRAVPPESLGAVRQYLPASVLAFNTEADVPSTNPHAFTPPAGG